jgi:hypothetical protein
MVVKALKKNSGIMVLAGVNTKHYATQNTFFAL